MHVMPGGVPVQFTIKWSDSMDYYNLDRNKCMPLIRNSFSMTNLIFQLHDVGILSPESMLMLATFTFRLPSVTSQCLQFLIIS